MNPKEAREMFRYKISSETTANMCLSYLQANLITLPSQYAFEFLLFCTRNPKACPLVEVMERGQTTSKLAKDSDIRTDLPRYRIYRNGVFEEEVTDIQSHWRDDFVTFLIGCSFTFEKALLNQGVRMLHHEQNKVVPMYKTNIPCEKAGIFSGNMVVSMRPLLQDEIDDSVRITERFQSSHGGPVHIGNPQEIGISDLEKPDYGENVEFGSDRVPVFWACGVTPQNVGVSAKPSIMISHSPGHMLITDQLEEYK
ncbi:putative hydro-lyase [Halalkalibacillus sediminis]|uniref:Putative hydro-lyase n=1 Tax=Halalkalibacillus sediminis TaxID=2018042 RepID=A0A2I0QUA9_9BACI|nr:putative hydro-lyase [Halalkalibacillus sediminis]PKR77932.1 putative hydro-lyase [Halalkalibacillus sediminis]